MPTMFFFSSHKDSSITRLHGQYFAVYSVDSSLLLYSSHAFNGNLKPMVTLLGHG